MIVLAVVTVTAAASIWAYFSRPEVTLDNAALLLARDMRLAQNRASLLHRPVSLIFREDGDGYRIVDGLEDSPLPRRGPERFERWYSRDAIFEGVKILRVGLGAGERLVFDGEGSTTPVGRITLSYEEETRTLELEAGTGRILLTGQ